MSTNPQFPLSTYRFQLNVQFTFKQTLQLVDYLDLLGVSHCYLSSILQAKSGSMHGYDIVDHSQINAEIGTPQEFEALVSALRKKNMGIILDIVPNHMFAMDKANRWWNNVLENGPSSPYANYFDIDWSPPRPQLANKVLLPLLEQPYGEALESQALKIIYQDGAFLVQLPGIELPTDPKSWITLLETIANHLIPRVDEDNTHFLELQSILTALTHLPERTALTEEQITERQREKEVIKHRLKTLFDQSELINHTLFRQLALLNGNKEDLSSFDDLESFLNEQTYRLCFWRVANDEINYRRFFDVCDLAGLCTENPEVFEATHALIFEMLRNNQLDGLRIDHVDGLLDPEKYLKELRDHGNFYLIVEKILTGNEKLRPEWPLDGTVGYEFLNLLNGIFVVQQNRKALHDIYSSFTENTTRIADQVYISKKLILTASMSSELSVLAQQLDRISQQHRSSRDFSAESLKAALRETIACFPAYRSYIDGPNGVIHEEDRVYIAAAISRAKRLNPPTSPLLFDFIHQVLLLEHPPGISEEEIANREAFIMRFQQLTGPVMAKGVEDTAFYRNYPLSSLNEVGADIYSFGTSKETFHEKNSERHESWPNTMTTTSTHDTKRSEDARARINVLSEIPEEWAQALQRWSQMNLLHKDKENDELVPSENEEYLLYQSIIGTWPLYPMDPAGHLEYTTRIAAYMDKALKEAKVHTSWINPNGSYDSKVKAFVEKILDPNTTKNPFIADLTKFMPKIIYAGMVNSINQTLLKVTCPGVPDFYQGNESWDFSLVDPDNRRAVDYEKRKQMLETIHEGMDKNLPELLNQMVQSPEDGRIKMYITTKLLHLRKAHQTLFSKGTYIPLKVIGSAQNQIIAYAWQQANKVVVVLATRFVSALLPTPSLVIDPIAWEGTKVLLPKEVAATSFVDLFTQTTITTEMCDNEAALDLKTIFKTLPLALLEGHND